MTVGIFLEVFNLLAQAEDFLGLNHQFPVSGRYFPVSSSNFPVSVNQCLVFSHQRLVPCKYLPIFLSQSLLFLCQPLLPRPSPYEVKNHVCSSGERYEDDYGVRNPSVQEPLSSGGDCANSYAEQYIPPPSEYPFNHSLNSEAGPLSGAPLVYQLVGAALLGRNRLDSKFHRHSDGEVGLLAVDDLGEDLRP